MTRTKGMTTKEINSQKESIALNRKKGKREEMTTTERTRLNKRRFYKTIPLIASFLRRETWTRNLALGITKGWNMEAVTWGWIHTQISLRVGQPGF